MTESEHGDEAGEEGAAGGADGADGALVTDGAAPLRGREARVAQLEHERRRLQHSLDHFDEAEAAAAEHRRMSLGMGMGGGMGGGGGGGLGMGGGGGGSGGSLKPLGSRDNLAAAVRVRDGHGNGSSGDGTGAGTGALAEAADAAMMRAVSSKEDFDYELGESTRGSERVRGVGTSYSRLSLWPSPHLRSPIVYRADPVGPGRRHPGPV